MLDKLPNWSLVFPPHGFLSFYSKRLLYITENFVQKTEKYRVNMFIQWICCSFSLFSFWYFLFSFLIIMQPRRGCFEIRSEDGEKFISLLVIITLNFYFFEFKNMWRQVLNYYLLTLIIEKTPFPVNLTSAGYSSSKIRI